jgi:hypothetical protein
MSTNAINGLNTGTYTAFAGLTLGGQVLAVGKGNGGYPTAANISNATAMAAPGTGVVIVVRN